MKKIKVSIIGPGLEPIVHVAKTGLIMKIVAGVVGVAVVGGGVALATRIWDPLWNPFRPEPEEVIEEMFAKMEELQTLHSEIKVEFEAIDEILKQETQLSVVVSGDLDISDSKNPKLAGIVDFITRSNGMQISVAGEYKNTEEGFFMKLNTIPALPIPGMDLSIIKGQWIKLDKEALKSLGKGVSEIEVSEEKQEELKEKLVKLFKEKKVYYVKEELPDQKINGKKAYHYLLALDREKIKEIIPELFKINMEFSEQPLGGHEFGTAFIAGGIAEAVDKFLEKIGGIDIEVWIGKKDNLLYKTKIEKEIDVSKFKKDGKGKMTIRFDMEFSNFDEPIKIEAPEKFMSIEEIFSSIMRGLPMFPGEPGMYPTIPEGEPTEYPYEQPFMLRGSSYSLQASFLEILSGLLE